jgi:hypothetical protein
MIFPRLPYRPHAIQEALKTLVQYARKSRVLPGGRRAGFVLLLAGLVASIALTLAASIFEISQKEVLLAAIGQDSEYAFYAADSAAECAEYWDSRFENFATPNPSTPTPTCDGQAVTVMSNTLAISGGGIKKVLYPSGTSWLVPNDWDDNDNSIELIGGGGGGINTTCNEGAGAGGGGGAYVIASNVQLKPNAPITIQVGTGGSHGEDVDEHAATTAQAGGDTIFNGIGNTCDKTQANEVCAQGGQAPLFGGSGTGGIGGSVLASVGPVGSTILSGGNGGNSAADGDPSGSAAGGGGGGAAGQHGPGGNAGNAGGTSPSPTNGGGGGGGDGGSVGIDGSSISSGNGGNNFSGTGGGAAGDSGNPFGSAGVNGAGGGAAWRVGGSATSGGAGGNGTEWDAAHGSGGGGGAGADLSGDGGATGQGGDGGLYGGGGGGNADLGGCYAGWGGNGAPGLIVVTYGGGGQVVGKYEYQYSPNGYCANVTVTKVSVAGAIRTFIEADGYNVPCTLISSSPDALQRAVELEY